MKATKILTIAAISAILAACGSADNGSDKPVSRTITAPAGHSDSKDTPLPTVNDAGMLVYKPGTELPMEGGGKIVFTHCPASAMLAADDPREPDLSCLKPTDAIKPGGKEQDVNYNINMR